MRHSLLAALLLLLPFLMGQQITGVKITGGIVGVVAGGGSDCGSTVCLAIVDFEGSGCADGDSGGEGSRTCTNSGADPDCTTGNCPLEGSLSAFFDAQTDLIYDDSLGEITTGFVTLDWIYRRDSGGSTDNDAVAGMISSNSPNFECRLLQATNLAFRAMANDGTMSSNTSISLGVTYWLRLTYDIANDDCTMRIWDDVWGGNEIGSARLANGSSAGSVIGYAFEHNFGAAPDVTIDDVGLCTGDLGGTSVHCTD